MDRDIFFIGIIYMMLFNLLIISYGFIFIFQKRKQYKKFVSTHKFIKNSNFFKNLGEKEKNWYLKKIIDYAYKHNYDNKKLMNHIKKIELTEKYLHI